MDWLKQKETLVQAVKKYRYVAVVLLAGVLLMLLPGKEENQEGRAEDTVKAEISLQESLSQLLSHMEGAGKVQVLLTESTGQEILYQSDEDQTITDSTRDRRSQTVLTENTDRQKTGLIRQINPPQYRGAVVLAQGADSATVRLSLVEAVMGATGLPSHCITVLKMK